MPITAIGTAGSAIASATPRHACATPASSAPTVRRSAMPSRSRPAMRTSWRCFQRRSSAPGSSCASRSARLARRAVPTSSECAAPLARSIAIAVSSRSSTASSECDATRHRHERVEELRIGRELVAEAAGAPRRAAPARPARSGGRPTGRAHDGRARCRRPSSTDECRAVPRHASQDHTPCGPPTHTIRSERSATPRSPNQGRLILGGCPGCVSVPPRSMPSWATSTATRSGCSPPTRPRWPQGCDLVVFPELMVTGYPPEDLLLRPAFVAAAAETVAKLAARTGECAAVIGFPERAGDPLQRGRGVRPAARCSASTASSCCPTTRSSTSSATSRPRPLPGRCSRSRA